MGYVPVSEALSATVAVAWIVVGGLAAGVLLEVGFEEELMVAWM